MRKTLCLVLALAMLFSALALAEDMFEFASDSVEQKLEQMLPVLDSLARCLRVTSDNPAFRPAYDPQDASLVWNQLWLMGTNWLAEDDQYRADGGITIPASVMEACAAASFGGLLPPLPALTGGAFDESFAEYDAARDAYILWETLGDGGWTVIERYVGDQDALLVNCGVYDGVTGLRDGGLTARLGETAGAQADPLFPYTVLDAHAETAADFDGLLATLCDIRRPAAGEIAEPAAIAEPTAVPTAAPTAYSTLSSGSRGEAVRALQQRLNALGYDCGSVDGVFGSATRRAVRYFQDAIGEAQDGVAGAELQRRLFGASAPEYQPYVNLKQGSGGIRVERLQERLRELGYTCAPVDGRFASRTLAAVKLFQAASGLKADGIAGAKTLKALESGSAKRCAGYIDLYRGDTGARVTEMQKQLKALGFLTGKASGRYDSATAKAVKAFKAERGIKGDGDTAEAGTVQAMFEAPAPTATPAVSPSPAPVESGAPTEAPAEKPTDAPTEAPATEAPTETPTEAPTETPAEKPTEAPTEKPTEKPAEKPAEPDVPDEGGEG